MDHDVMVVDRRLERELPIVAGRRVGEELPPSKVTCKMQVTGLQCFSLPFMGQQVRSRKRPSTMELQDEI